MDVEDLPDLSDWMFVDVWTLKEAAQLWAAIDPMAHEGKPITELKGIVQPKQYLKMRIYLRAAQEAVCAGTLSFTEAWEEHRDEDGNIWCTETKFPKLPSPRLICPDMTRVQRAAFLKWVQSKQIPSLRQTLARAKKSQPLPVVVDVQENMSELPQEPMLLLGKPSPLDQTHPCHSEELKLGIEAWEIAVETGAPKKGKTVKTSILEVLETYPQFSHLSKDARIRISVMTNWAKKGGATPTPAIESLPTPAE